MKPVAANRFSVSLDGGPQFRATYVRLERDDPISLSILIDVSAAQSAVLTDPTTVPSDPSLMPEIREPSRPECATLRPLNVCLWIVGWEPSQGMEREQLESEDCRILRER
jgi:hypothetical protein